MGIGRPPEADIKLVRNSELFDASWYLAQYKDVEIIGMDPAEHYLWLGWQLSRNPSPNFNTVKYLAAHADVAKAGVNPLLHYIKWGKKEGRLLPAAVTEKKRV